MPAFDVFLKGINPERLNETTEIKQLACQYLKLEAKQLDALLDAPGTHCLCRGVSEQKAKDYQTNLSKIGIICVYRPGAELSGLSLVPIETEFSADGVFSCPSCGYEERLEEGQSPPEKCKQCGISIDSFLDMQKIKAEKAEIRNNFLRAQQAKKQFEAKQQQEEAEEKRKKALENSVLAEMRGNQKKKQHKMMSLAVGASALAIIGGIAYNIGGAANSALNKPDAQPTAQAEQVAANANNDVAATGVPAADSQAQIPAGGAGLSMEEAHDKANKVLNAVGLDADAMANSGGGAAPPDAEPPASPGSPTATANDVLLADNLNTPANAEKTSITADAEAITGVHEQPSADSVAVTQAAAPADSDDTAADPLHEMSGGITVPALSESDNSPEWDLFLSKSVTALVAKNSLADAVRLGKHIADQESYVAAMGAILGAAYKTDQLPLANEIIAALESRIEALSINSQAQYFAQAGFYQAQASGLNSLTAQAEKIFTGLTDSESQLKSSLKIAVHYFKAGDTESANRHFKQTNALLNNVQATARQISARAAIARAYNDVGSRGSALKWLASTDKFVNDITADSRQELIESYAYINQWQTALDLIKKAESDTAQNALILKAINVSLKANLTQNALNFSQAIQAPFYKAIAYDQIASYTQSAADTLALAEKLLADIKNPANQAIVSSLLARHYARIAIPQKATELSQLATQQLAMIAPASKDDVIAVVAKNLARSLQIEPAKQQLAAIQSQDVKAQLHAEINKTIEVGSILKLL
jgi:hypothetical protein